MQCLCTYAVHNILCSNAVHIMCSFAVHTCQCTGYCTQLSPYTCAGVSTVPGLACMDAGEPSNRTPAKNEENLQEMTQHIHIAT